MRAPSSKGSEGRHLLIMTVRAAIESATVTGNLDMANAIQQMYDSSLSDPVLAELMDAVLAHKATHEQHLQFRAVMRGFRDLNSRFAKPRDPALIAAEAAAAAERGRLGSMSNPVLIDDMQSRPPSPKPRFRLDPGVEVVQLSSSDDGSGTESEDSSGDDDNAMSVERSEGGERGQRQGHEVDSDSDSDSSSQASLEIIYDSRREGAPRTLGYPDHIPRPRTKSKTPTEPEPYKNRYGLRDRAGALVGPRGSDDWILRPPKAVHWTPDYSHGDSLKRKRTSKIGTGDAVSHDLSGRGDPHRQEISTALVGNIKALKAKLGSVPNSKTVPGRHILSIVVDGCMRRSGAEGNPAVGEAIRTFYDESLSDPSLAEFLDELFAGKATQQQVHQFQTYVRDHLHKAGAAVFKPVKSTVAAQPPAGVFAKPMAPVEVEGIAPVIITVGERGSLNRGPPEPEYKEPVVARQPPVVPPVVVAEALPVEKATLDLGQFSTPPPSQNGMADTGAAGDGTSMSSPGLATGIDCLPRSSNDDSPLPSFSFAHVPEISSIRSSVEFSPSAPPPLITPESESLKMIGSPYLFPHAGSSLEVPPSPTASTSTLVDSDMTEV